MKKTPKMRMPLRMKTTLKFARPQGSYLVFNILTLVDGAGAWLLRDAGERDGGRGGVGLIFRHTLHT